MTVSVAVLVGMHEVSGLSIAELHGMMGDRRTKFGISDNELTAFNRGRRSQRPLRIPNVAMSSYSTWYPVDSLHRAYQSPSYTTYEISRSSLTSN